MLRKISVYAYKNGTTPSSPPRVRRGNRPNFIGTFQYEISQYRDGGEVDNFNKYMVRNISE